MKIIFKDIDISSKYEKIIMSMLYLVVTLITYGMFLRMHYSVDSYSIIYDSSGTQFLMQGRILAYVINILFNNIGINLTLHQQIFSLYLIICIAISSTILFFIIWDQVKNKSFVNWSIVNFSVIISFSNVFFLEWFLYPESTFFFGTSLLCTVIAIHSISKGQRIINIIVSFLNLMFAMAMYQANLGIFIIYSLTICLIRNKDRLDKAFIKKSIIILSIGFFNSIFNILLLKATIILGIANKGDRMPSITVDVIKNNMLGILKAQKQIWSNGDGFLPKCSLIFFTLIILVVLFKTILKKENYKSNICYIVLILFINYSIIFAPHLFTSTLWLAPRTIVGFFIFLVSIILLVLLYNENNRRILRVLFLLTSSFIILNIVQIQNIGVNHIASNKIDRQYALMINNEIEKYEMQNNTKITNIATSLDMQPTYFYKGIEYAIYDTNIRAFITSWADVNIINYYSGGIIIR
ncbi:glucosyltransferase domain-containing protein [Clostridium beijerinckii]|uniref:Glucosyl transferase GtrII n=1 Tax=Clostridium beijerinckii TaxID=1520 RepID=A0A9Q5CII5_CLOBE|nr:glucosyltransferase domain-containing protein [Clostridium beijerinckii]NRV09366.1 hypothetical protein [Clostridium beijerinckii]